MAMKNVFVMALDDFNRAMLERLQGAEGIQFHSLLDLDTAVDTRHYDIPALLERARTQLREFPERVDAVVGFWDFPTSTMLPIIQREFGLNGSSLESVLFCEHKYLSRVEQAKVAPAQTPAFAAFNPFDPKVLDEPPLAYPFWVKPVRSHSSQLGFRVNNREDFAHAVSQIRRNIHFLAEPFNELMRHAQLPDSLKAVDGWHCMAEQIISGGRQCTVEGYVLDGEITIYGTIDSLREGVHNSSFSRYQYPSSLPEAVQRDMYDAVEGFLKQVGFNNPRSTWNFSTRRKPISSGCWR